ncbi:MAG: orotidine-5'-phosphate decarboxylase [Candidatus Kapabacteria bacterium]|nr:orotidine-5'-phosphate decarboxylase [Candidatus Kapabacteria bacterium]
MIDEAIQTVTIFDKILDSQRRASTCLCVGLDTDMNKLPSPLPKSLDGILEFNRTIIKATQQHCSSYKINFAFYEQYGSAGYALIEQTRAMIPDTHVSIADAKRGDIGNTSAAYAKAILGTMDFDAITVSPYMGADSVEPFLAFENKLVFVLALTSNSGSRDFQYTTSDARTLYERVILQSQQWRRTGILGYVVGATHPGELAAIRNLIPDAPLLIPGVGTQGGDAQATMQANGNGIAFINASRSIIYASSGDDYAHAAGIAAATLARSVGINE